MNLQRLHLMGAFFSFYALMWLLSSNFIRLGTNELTLRVGVEGVPADSGGSYYYCYKKSQHKTTGKEVLLADFFSGFFFLLLGRATVLFGGSGVGATFV